MAREAIEQLVATNREVVSAAKAGGVFDELGGEGQGGVARVGIGLDEEHGDGADDAFGVEQPAALFEGADDLGDEPRLADARLGRDHEGGGFGGERGRREGAEDLVDLAFSSDAGRGVAEQGEGADGRVGGLDRASGEFAQPNLGLRRAGITRGTSRRGASSPRRPSRGRRASQDAGFRPENRAR